MRVVVSSKIGIDSAERTAGKDEAKLNSESDGYKNGDLKLASHRTAASRWYVLTVIATEVYRSGFFIKLRPQFT